jgi:PAS domain S-box-containing protein
MSAGVRNRGSKRAFFSSRREEIIEKQYDEIKRLESRYQKLYDEAPDMYRTINTEGIILDCNLTYVNDLGFASKAEVIGHSLFEHTAEKNIEAMRESFDEWRQTGKVRNKEVWFRRKDGSIFPVLISANNLYDDTGKLIGSNSVIIDETQMYEARRKLELGNEKLVEAQKLKDEFISIASHELRTPIQPLLSYAELAQSGLVNQKDAWQIVVAQARRLKKLADDILDVSRIESGSLNYQMKPVKINELILEIVAACFSPRKYQIEKDKPGYTDRGRGERVAIETSLGGGDIQVMIDERRITQAITNILNNAMKFTEMGKILITTDAISESKLFEIRITDTGKGIANEILPNLFGKFVTKSMGDEVNKHGTGLGLFISKSIIQAHNGEIFGYNNESGKGATFVLRLPLKK